MTIISKLFSLLGVIAVVLGLALVLNIVSVKEIQTLTGLKSATSQTPTTPTPTPLAQILTASIDQNCQFNVKTDQDLLTIPTNFDQKMAKCEDYVLFSLSPNGQYLVFEDLSAKGVDSLLKVFAYKKQKPILIQDLAKYSILDFAFFPSSDKLAVLISEGLKGKQLVYIYNLNYLYEKFGEEMDKNAELTKQALKTGAGELELATTTKRATKLKIVNQELQILEEKTETPIQTFALENF